jgi:hypothetical protein
MLLGISERELTIIAINNPLFNELYYTKICNIIAISLSKYLFYLIFANKHVITLCSVSYSRRSFLGFSHPALHDGIAPLFSGNIGDISINVFAVIYE